MTQEEKTAHKKLINGYIMAGCGFLLILLAAMNYLFGWKAGTPSTAIGIIFLAIGAGWIRKAKQGMKSEERKEDSE